MNGPPPLIAPLRPREKVCVVGKTGTGKSTFAKQFARQLREHHQRVIAFDPHDEYSVKGKRSPEVRLGPLAQRIHIEELIIRHEILDAENLSLAVIPNRHPQVMAEQFVELVSLIEHTGDLVLIADEVGEYEVYCRPTLNQLGTQSRHWLVTAVFVAQRMVQIPKTARAQSAHVFSFLQTDPEDLDAIAHLCGGVHGGKEFAAEVSRLPAGEWMHWRDELNRS